MSEIECGNDTRQEHHHLKRDITVSVIAFLIMAGLLVWAFLNWEMIENYRQFGYVGLFVLGILTGAVSFIPIPGILAVFSLGSVLSPPFVGRVYGFGEAVGSMLIYFEGYSGRAAIAKTNNRMLLKMKTWLEEKGAGIILLMSAIINPVYLPFAAMAGMMRYGVVKFFLLCFLGKTIKNTVIAYLGYFGLGAILRMIGVPV
jgi:membrane protein YqaA with SNARE-associated domain